MAPPGNGALAERRSLAFRAQFVPSAQVFRRFAALAAVAAAVADEMIATGATAGAEARGVELLGAQLVPQRISQAPGDGPPLMLNA